MLSVGARVCVCTVCVFVCTQVGHLSSRFYLRGAEVSHAREMFKVCFVVVVVVEWGLGWGCLCVCV